MQKNQAEPKTYSFYFNRNMPNTSPLKSNTIIDHVQSCTHAKSVNINFRYQMDGLQTEKKVLTRKQSFKSQLNQDKSCEASKKYTFSLINNQEKQQKILENRQYNHNQSNLSSKESSHDLLPEKPKIEKNHSRSNNNATKCSFHIGLDRNYTLQMVKQRQGRLVAQKERNVQKNQIIQLSQRMKILQKQIQQKDNKIKTLQQQLYMIKQLNTQKDRLTLHSPLKNKGKQLMISSQILTFQTQDFEQSFEKQAKQWSNSTIIYNYEEQYKQILSVFQIELSEENYHDRLLNQVDKLFKRVEEGDKMVLYIKQKQKQHIRLIHHLKKIEGQMIRVSNMIAPLTKQIEKTHNLLQQANRQIQVLNLSCLNRKYQDLVS